MVNTFTQLMSCLKSAAIGGGITIPSDEKATTMGKKLLCQPGNPKGRIMNFYSTTFYPIFVNFVDERGLVGRQPLIVLTDIQRQI